MAVSAWDFTVGVAGICDRCGTQAILQAGERDYLDEPTEHICGPCAYGYPE